MMDLTMIIPLYKGRNYLRYWIEKVEKNIVYCQLCNLFIECEILFVNDFPEEEIVLEDSGIEGLDIKVYNLPENKGIHGARVFGYKQASGKYIVFVDQDDKIADNYILSQMNHIGDNDAVVSNGYRKFFCRSGRRIMYGTEEQQRDYISPEKLIYRGCGILSPGQVMIKKESIPPVWLENVMKINGVDDYFLWLLMSKENRKMGINPEKLFTHIGHGDNTSGNSKRMMKSTFEMLKILEQNKVLSQDEINVIRTRKSNVERDKFLEMAVTYDYWMYLKINGKNTAEYFEEMGYHKIAIYGMSYIGNRLYDELRDSTVEVVLAIDQNAKQMVYEIPILEVDEISDFIKKIDVIVVTATSFFEEISSAIKEKYDVPVLSIRTVLVEMCKQLQEM